MELKNQEKRLKRNLGKKQRKLMDLHEEGLPSREFDEAMIILKKDPSAYTEVEKKLSDNIEELLKGTITIGTYIDRRIDISKLIEEK